MSKHSDPIAVMRRPENQPQIDAWVTRQVRWLERHEAWLAANVATRGPRPKRPRLPRFLGIRED